jgi:hypothetical protein
LKKHHLATLVLCGPTSSELKIVLRVNRPLGKYLDFFFEAAPTKSQKLCDTTRTSLTAAADVDDDDDEVLLRSLAMDDWPKVPVSEARPLSCKSGRKLNLGLSG